MGVILQHINFSIIYDRMIARIKILVHVSMSHYKTCDSTLDITLSPSYFYSYFPLEID